VALVVIILFSGFAAALFMENLWWGVLGCGLLFLAMWNWFLPSSYTLDERGAGKKSVFGTESKDWSHVKSFIPDRNGVLLSPFPTPTRLAKFRGLSLQFSGNRKEVLEFIRTRVEPRGL
jgi:hypothetical protein